MILGVAQNFAPCASYMLSLGANLRSWQELKKLGTDRAAVVMNPTVRTPHYGAAVLTLTFRSFRSNTVVKAKIQRNMSMLRSASHIGTVGGEGAPASLCKTCALPCRRCLPVAGSDGEMPDLGPIERREQESGSKNKRGICEVCLVCKAHFSALSGLGCPESWRAGQSQAVPGMLGLLTWLPLAGAVVYVHEQAEGMQKGISRNFKEKAAGRTASSAHVRTT